MMTEKEAYKKYLVQPKVTSQVSWTAFPYVAHPISTGRCCCFWAHNATGASHFAKLRLLSHVVFDAFGCTILSKPDCHLVVGQINMQQPPGRQQCKPESCRL